MPKKKERQRDKDMVIREVFCFRANEDDARAIRKSLPSGLTISEHLRKIVTDHINSENVNG